jgi:outer membrane protein
MKKIIVFALLIYSLAAAAQNSVTTIQYSMGFGTGDLGSYINKASFRGFIIDYRKMVQPNIGVGVDMGWNVFYEEKPYDTYTSGSNDISGKQFRYNNQFPMLVAADYYLSPGEKINPFAGIGIGTMYSLRNTDMGTWTLEQNAWHFALCPEAGVLLNIKPGLDFSLSAKYYHGFKSGDLSAQSYFALNLGFVFTGN